MIFELVWHRVLRTVTNASMQTTDISFPRNRKGSVKPLRTLWRSTMGVQSTGTLASVRSDPLRALRILIWLLRVIGQALRIHPIEYTDTMYQLDYLSLY